MWLFAFLLAVFFILRWWRTAFCFRIGIGHCLKYILDALSKFSDDLIDLVHGVTLIYQPALLFLRKNEFLH
jgi:hypothetical protein